jgi:hypothetical protein
MLKLSAMLLATNIRIQIQVYGLNSIYNGIFMNYLLMMVSVCEDILLGNGKLYSRYIPASLKFPTEYSSSIITVSRKFIKI